MWVKISNCAFHVTGIQCQAKNRMPLFLVDLYTLKKTKLNTL